MVLKPQRAVLVSSVAGFFMWGLISTIGPLSLSFPFLHGASRAVATEVLTVGPIFILLGNVIMGIVSDRVGRKLVFVATMISYGVGVILVSLTSSLLFLIIGIILSQFGIGGEEPPSLALVAESFGKATRARWLTFTANFDNIGSAFISGLLLASVAIQNFLYGIFSNSFIASLGQEEIFFRFALLVSALCLIAIMVYARFALPESVRWLSVKGVEPDSSIREQIDIDQEVKRSPPRLALSIPVLMVIGVSQYLTFGLMSYIIGPYEFPDYSAQIIFYGLLGSTVAGFIAMPLINRERRGYTLWSFAGGFITIIVILALVPDLSNLYIFFPLLFINMMFSEFAWASRTTLEPEVFPTRYRSTAIGLVRVAPMVAYILSVYYTANLDPFQFILFNAILWGIGVVGAVVWYLMGLETKDVNIDYETKKVPELQKT
ncbi:MFS transporter [Thermoplasmatales archaeon AK]|nr:MFS transporter [Thermoplasmatales archaeon AK]